VPALVEPTVALHAAWLEAHHEWGPGRHEDGFGLAPGDDVETPAGFAAWVARSRQAPGAALWWIVEDGAVVGGIAFRHQLDDEVLQARGHVGYGIRPSARGRGLATWALRQVLTTARALGMSRVLVVCQEGNSASARVIERCGGVLDGVRDTADGRIRRYRVDTTADAG
jgi:predicted acetyltransferase